MVTIGDDTVDNRIDSILSCRETGFSFFILLVLQADAIFMVAIAKTLPHVEFHLVIQGETPILVTITGFPWPMTWANPFSELWEWRATESWGKPLVKIITPILHGRHCIWVVGSIGLVTFLHCEKQIDSIKLWSRQSNVSQKRMMRRKPIKSWWESQTTY